MQGMQNGGGAPSEPSWPVTIFRYTQNLGWQQQVGKDGKALVLQASPRRNCVVIPALHQKFSLSNDTDEGDRGSVIRRNDCILLLSRARTKVMLLKFNSISQCIAFSDCFVSLNPPMDPPEDPSPAKLSANKEAILSFVVRLLHDQEFEGFVSGIEATLLASVDGQQLLSSWRQRDLQL
eukprot:Nitzschia sp. Nitz4//scaffold38_size140716//46751//47374//NITZ4_003136-RA/size140716-snap-gene-0.137-mRNA-1//1//CDS//3329550045//345//frame0